MRGLGILAGLAMVVAGGVACSGGAPASGAGGSGKPAGSTTAPAAAPSIGPVSLPEQPSALVGLIGVRVRAAQSVRATMLVTSVGDDGKVYERITTRAKTDSPTPAAQLTIEELNKAKPTTTHAVALNGSIYTRLEGTVQARGKPWMRLARQDIDPAKIGPFARVFTTILDETDKALREATSETGLALVKNGSLRGKPDEADLSGVQVRRYEGVTDTAKMAAADKTYGQMQQEGLKELNWTLWVDKNGLPHKFAVTIIEPGGKRAESSVTYSEWGKPVSIQAPPTQQVATLKDLGG